MTQATETKKENLSIVKRGAIAEIHLHVNKANSYTLDYYRELNEAIDEIRFDSEIKVVVMVSDMPKFFSAGADINFLKAAEPRFKTQFCLFCNETLDKIARSPQIYIACLEGHTVGGGLEMALACDLRFMGDDSGNIGLPEISLGVLAGTGGTQRLARLVGFSQALDMNLTGALYTPEEALDMGLVNRVFPQEETRAKTMEYAEKVANTAPYAASNIKLSIMNGKEMPLNAAIRYEGELQNLLFRSEDAKEGLSAFLEKRSPDWKGV